MNKSKVNIFRKIFLCGISTLSLISCGNDLIDGEHNSSFFYSDSLQTVINKGVRLADPFILLVKDKYYAYGTNAAEGFKCYISTDLMTWELHSDFILHKDDVIGNWGFWAPEIIYDKMSEKFFIYYTAEQISYVAESDNPLGPFTNAKNIIPTASIDASPFIDDDGKKYLFYKREDLYFDIRCYVLTDNMTTLESQDPTVCLKISQHWENTILEGPYVFKHKGWYYMTYSSWGYQSSNYGIGYAVAESPMGPWTKYKGNPILQYPEVGNSGIWGTGHSMMFTDKSGKMRIAFHAHGSLDFKEDRTLFIGDVVFEDNKDGEAPVMRIANIFCPQLSKE